MCLTAEQERKKNEAMRDAERQLSNTVNGTPARSAYNSHAAHLPMNYESQERMEHGERL